MHFHNRRPGTFGVDLFSDLQPRITEDDKEAANKKPVDNLSKTTLMGPVPKYIVFKVKMKL